jgi:hypothetical protein
VHLLRTVTHSHHHENRLLTSNVRYNQPFSFCTSGFPLLSNVLRSKQLQQLAVCVVPHTLPNTRLSPLCATNLKSPRHSRQRYLPFVPASDDLYFSFVRFKVQFLGSSYHDVLLNRAGYNRTSPVHCLPFSAVFLELCCREGTSLAAVT